MIKVPLNVEFQGADFHKTGQLVYLELCLLSIKLKAFLKTDYESRHLQSSIKSRNVIDSENITAFEINQD